MSLTRSVRVLAVVALAASAVVSVLAAPASAVTVSDEAALRAAFADTAVTSITLTGDIDLTDCAAGQLTRPGAATALTLSGAFTIRQTCAGKRVIGSAPFVATGSLTVNDVTITGGNAVELVDPFASGAGINWIGDLMLNRAIIVGNSGTAPLGGFGGGVFVDGTLTVNQSTIAQNEMLSSGTWGGHGGGVAATGTITIIDSTIADNVAGGGTETGGQAGGVFGGPELVLLRTTVSGNVARQNDSGTQSGWNGGVVGRGSLEVVNSTITSNVAEGATSLGGGIATTADATVAYSTIVDNSAALGANLAFIEFDPGDSVSVFASVIGRPLGGGTDCSLVNPIASEGYNYATDASCGLTATADVQSGADPLLGALANNGGLTHTRLPAMTSPLLDRVPLDHCQDGTGAGVSTDQRDVTRPQGAGCDVGAVEVAVTVSPPPGSEPVSPPCRTRSRQPRRAPWCSNPRLTG